jgi:dipeptidase E
LKLIFYSGGDHEDNTSLDEYCVKMALQSGRPAQELKYTYIPASSYDSEIEFHNIVGAISPYGITKFLHFPVDIPFDRIMEKEVFSGDIIHLGGGNTFHFLQTLRRKKLLPKLRQFVKRGGVLTGLSAGAIMMTPSITTASFPSFDRDDNDEGITDFKSLGLVKFDFFPHYKNSIRYDLELATYSTTIKHPLYCSPDGHGIIVNGDKLIFVGKTYMFRDGHKITISS